MKSDHTISYAGACLAGLFLGCLFMAAACLFC